MKVLALDFDGVICDSIDECLVVARGAYAVWRGDEREEPTSLNVATDLASRFRHSRYLVGPAGEYWVLMDLLYKHDGTPDSGTFLKHRAENEGCLAEYEPLFFRTREKLRTDRAEAWLSLHSVYPQYRSAVGLHACQCPVYVVTTKDRPTVVALNAGLDLGLDANRLWTKEDGTNKAVAIRHIAGREGCSTQDVSFVDDNPRHLADAVAIGARCYWASWGYTPPNAAPGTGVRRVENVAQVLKDGLNTAGEQPGQQG